jgi:hypothetical protein
MWYLQANKIDYNEDEFYKFFTKKGNLKMTAESIYCFISNNPEFKEAHTAVQDCKIEYEIYKYLRKRGLKRQKEGNWLTILLNYFGQYRKTETIANEFKKKFAWQLKKQSYTNELVSCFLS